VNDSGTTGQPIVVRRTSSRIDSAARMSTAVRVAGSGSAYGASVTVVGR
jgi:hypothetical protein